MLGLGRAPPKVITVEYDPNDVDAFIEIADAIEEAFPKVIVNGNEQGPGRPGSFEVRVNSPSRRLIFIMPISSAYGSVRGVNFSTVCEKSEIFIVVTLPNTVWY